MGVTVYTSSLKMAITILINMTQRTRNHSMEFLLSVTTTTGLCGGTRKQGGSQHVVSARGILSSGRPKETDCNKRLVSWRASGDRHLLSCFCCSPLICCHLWVLFISKAQSGV